MADTDWIVARPVAHRGLHDPANGIAENSLAAARAAIENNYAIEVDIRPSADAAAMVFHDATLERMTGHGGRVEQNSAEALSRLRLGGSKETIATLDQLLELVAGRSGLFLEIKTDDLSDTKLGQEFLRHLSSRVHSYAGPVAVMSFDPQAVGAMARLAPQIPRGFVSRGYRERADLAKHGALGCWWRRNLIPVIETRARFVAYDAQALPAPAPALARRAGFRLLSWTVRDEAEKRRIAASVDQIIFEGFRP